MFKGTPDYVLTYFKCWAGKDANEGEAGFATLKGMQSLAMNAEALLEVRQSMGFAINTSSRARVQMVLALAERF
jgi:hypothetical protein